MTNPLPTGRKPTIDERIDEVWRLVVADLKDREFFPLPTGPKPSTRDDIRKQFEAYLNE